MQDSYTNKQGWTTYTPLHLWHHVHAQVRRFEWHEEHEEHMNVKDEER